MIMNDLILMGAIEIKKFCTEAAEILQFCGWVLTIFKVAIPLLIIALGMFDLGKAVVASKDDEIKKSTKALLNRAIAGIFIFFIPAIVLWLFGAVGNYNTADAQAGFKVCRDCVLTPWNCQVTEREY